MKSLLLFCFACLIVACTIKNQSSELDAPSDDMSMTGQLVVVGTNNNSKTSGYGFLDSTGKVIQVDLSAQGAAKETELRCSFFHGVKAQIHGFYQDDEIRKQFVVKRIKHLVTKTGTLHPKAFGKVGMIPFKEKDDQSFGLAASSSIKEGEKSKQNISLRFDQNPDKIDGKTVYKIKGQYELVDCKDPSGPAVFKVEDYQIVE